MDGTPSLFSSLVRAVTLSGHRRPWRTVLAGLLVFGVLLGIASTMKRLNSDPIALLPSDSAPALRYLDALKRLGTSGATVQVIVESPDKLQNQRFVDALERELRAVPPAMVERVEVGPGEPRKFVLAHRWLFADLADLKRVECELQREKDSATGADLGLEEPCDEVVSAELVELAKRVPELARQLAQEKRTAAAASASAAAAGVPSVAPSASAAPAGEKPLQRFQREMETRRKELDRFPDGYYRSADGSRFIVVVVAKSGSGFSGDVLVSQVQAAVDRAAPARFHPELRAQLTGDILVGIAQRDAVLRDVAWVSALGIGLILLSIVVYFRSLLSLVHVGLCVFTGMTSAFALAAVAFGQLNTATAFLGPLIAGNGINYAIVYMARFREQRLAGVELQPALEDAADVTRRGTWLASLAASGSFAALLITSFRGFSEFGAMGGLGMVACWFATFALLPASLTLVERWWPTRAAGSSSAATLNDPTFAAFGALGRFVAARPVSLLLVSLAITAGLSLRLAAYVVDPFEYDFSKLGSRQSNTSGPGALSRKSNEVFQSRGAPHLVLAASSAEVRAIALDLQERDEKQFGDRLVKRVETIHDAIGGPPELVEAKLAALDSIRTLLDKALPRLSEEDARVARDWRPPDGLRAIRPEELPALLRMKFTERTTGKLGTPVWVTFEDNLSQSDGHNLLALSKLLEGAHHRDGSIVPNASRASIFAEMIRSIDRDGPRATLLALAIVVLLTAAMTLRLVPTLVVLGALALGLSWMLGWAAWTNERLNFLNFIALPITFGIGVDYAINLYDRIEHAAGDVEDGLRSAGGPVLLCSLTTIFGYLSLMASDNMALQSFGRLAVVGEITCIVTALVAMPAVAALIFRTAKQRA